MSQDHAKLFDFDPFDAPRSREAQISPLLF